MKAFDTKALKYPNHLQGMMFRPLILLTFPVIVYSGFSYGFNLIWFNVLNGMASLMLSAAPYNFSSSIVGLSYFPPLIGIYLWVSEISNNTSQHIVCLLRPDHSTVAA